ncbi:MAG: hypothetical protein EBR67_11400, partial [Proteobacteria bacterium]|nr:hypothetical protein [Pseudomonadota bacterium]
TLSVVSGLIVGNIPGVITTVASTATTSLARDRIRLRENRFRKNLSSIIKGEATSKNDPFTKLDLSVYISKELDDNDVIKLLTYIKLQEELGISLFINSTDDTEDNPNRVFLLELNYAKVKSKVKDYLKDKGYSAKEFLEIAANSITHNQIASSIREIHKSQQTKEVLISTGAAAGKAVLAGAVTALLPLVGQPVAAFILDKIEDLLDLIPENIFEMLKDFLLNSANRTVLGLKSLLDNIADYTSKKMVPDLNRRFVVILKFLNATFNLSSDNKEHQELKQQLNSLIGKLESSYIRKSDPSVSINSEVTAPDDYIQLERRTGGRSVSRPDVDQFRRDSVTPRLSIEDDPD